MRRIRRWFLNALTMLSLAMCVATVILWARSYWRADDIERLHFQTTSDGVTLSRTFFHSEYGGLVVFRLTEGIPSTFLAAHQGRLTLHDRTNRETTEADEYPSLGPPTFKSESAFAGFKIARKGRSNDPALAGNPMTSAIGVIAPAWAAVLMLGIMPVRRAWRMVRSRRRAAGSCSLCFYDLTGNVSGVCPECGTSVVKPGSG